MSELVRLAKEALKRQQALDPVLKASTIQTGDTIRWERAGVECTAQVDFVHTDADGQTWAFVTIGSSWAAVNVKYVEKA